MCYLRLSGLQRRVPGCLQRLPGWGPIHSEAPPFARPPGGGGWADDLEALSIL